MAGAVRKSKMKEVPLSKVKDDLSRFLREAETQDVVITRHGKPAGMQSRCRPLLMLSPQCAVPYGRA